MTIEFSALATEARTQHTSNSVMTITTENKPNTNPSIMSIPLSCLSISMNSLIFFTARRECPARFGKPFQIAFRHKILLSG